MSKPPIKVLYIAGRGRSGSTILDNSRHRWMASAESVSWPILPLSFMTPPRRAVAAHAVAAPGWRSVASGRTALLQEMEQRPDYTSITNSEVVSAQRGR
jgi:hypothetical protein